MKLAIYLVIIFLYLILAERCIIPSFNPKSGTFVNEVTIIATSPTPNSRILYSLNGDDPSQSKDSKIKNLQEIDNHGVIHLNTPGKFLLKAISHSAGLDDSLIYEGVYTIFGKVDTPIFDEQLKNNDVLAAPSTVRIKCLTEGARIYYTTDGSFPTASSEIYNEIDGIIFKEAGDFTIKAIALHDELAQSDVVSLNFHIKPRAGAPSPSPPPGNFVGSVDVTINCIGTFYYTIDGTSPVSPDDNNTSQALPCGSIVKLDTEGRDGNIMLQVMVQGTDNAAPSMPGHYLYSITRRAQEIWPIRKDKTDDVSPDVNVYVVEKVFALSGRVRGRLVILSNADKHFTFLPPVGGCSAGLSLPSNSGRGFDPMDPIARYKIDYINATTTTTTTRHKRRRLRREEGVHGQEPKSSPKFPSVKQHSPPNHEPGLEQKHRKHNKHHDPKFSFSPPPFPPQPSQNPPHGKTHDHGRRRRLVTEKMDSFHQYMDILSWQSKHEHHSGELRAQRSRSDGRVLIEKENIVDADAQFEHERELGCQVTTNAGFFNTSTGACVGNVVVGGVVMSRSHLHNVNFGIRNGSFVTGYVADNELGGPGNEDHAYDTLVSGILWLVRNGEEYLDDSMSADGDAEDLSMQDTGTQFSTVKSARTIIGHDKAGRLMLLQIEGQTWVRGSNLNEVTKFAIDLGFHNAINLDGGGSATMTINETLVSEPSWGCNEMNTLNGQMRSSVSALETSGATALLSETEGLKRAARCEKPVASITCIHAAPPKGYFQRTNGKPKKEKGSVTKDNCSPCPTCDTNRDDKVDRGNGPNTGNKKSHRRNDRDRDHELYDGPIQNEHGEERGSETGVDGHAPPPSSFWILLLLLASLITNVALFYGIRNGWSYGDYNRHGERSRFDSGIQMRGNGMYSQLDFDDVDNDHNPFSRG